MKFSALALVLAITITHAAHAAPVDRIGGPDGTTQTMHHCGYLPATAKLYTASAVTARLVERKLAALGYAADVDGNFSARDIQAVKQFQSDYGLAADGVVGPQTAQRLAFISHPSAHVHGCERLAGAF